MDGWRASASAAGGAAEAAVVAVERLVRAAVDSAGALFDNPGVAVRRFAAQVLQAAAQNVALTTRAFEEGEVGIAQVVVFRTAAIAAQLEYLDVLTDTYRAWFELAAAVGIHPDQLSELLGADD
jgi:outer membrane protein TolC